jgi:hypothetical protein
VVVAVVVVLVVVLVVHHVGEEAQPAAGSLPVVDFGTMEIIGP